MSGSMKDFQDFIQDLQLCDVELRQNFTWMRRSAASKIDRVFVDKEFFLTFPRLLAYCKNRMFSDHFPIVVGTSEIWWGPTPFRTLDCWLEEPSFLGTFKKEWVRLTGEPLEMKLKLLEKPLQKWNWEIFGHIDTKIWAFREELARLDDLAQTSELAHCEWFIREAIQTQLWKHQKSPT